MAGRNPAGSIRSRLFKFIVIPALLGSVGSTAANKGWFSNRSSEYRINNIRTLDAATCVCQKSCIVETWDESARQSRRYTISPWGKIRVFFDQPDGSNGYAIVRTRRITGTSSAELHLWWPEDLNQRTELWDFVHKHIITTE